MNAVCNNTVKLLTKINLIFFYFVKAWFSFEAQDKCQIICEIASKRPKQT